MRSAGPSNWKCGAASDAARCAWETQRRATAGTSRNWGQGPKRRTGPQPSLVAKVSCLAAPAAAQLLQASAGLVVVNIGDIEITDFLSDNQIDVLRHANILSGNNVAVPVSMVAAVCNLQVGVLARRRARGGGCTALGRPLSRPSPRRPDGLQSAILSRSTAPLPMPTSHPEVCQFEGLQPPFSNMRICQDACAAKERGRPWKRQPLETTRAVLAYSFLSSLGASTSIVGTCTVLFSVPTFTSGASTSNSGSWPPLAFTSTSGSSPSLV